MRRAVNFLQSLHRLHEDEITPDDVRDVAILCPPAKIDEVIREARNKSYDNMLSKVHALLQVKTGLGNLSEKKQAKKQVFSSKAREVTELEFFRSEF